MNKTQFTQDLKDKDLVRTSFLVKLSAIHTGKTGKPFMNLVLMDRTGEIEARLFEDVSQYAGQVVRDALVWVDGKCQVYQGRKQIVVQKIQLLREDEVVLDEFLIPSKVDSEVNYQKLLGWIATMQDPYYRALAESVLVENTEIVQKIKIAPAAKTIHHAYRGGLLEHMVSIVQILEGLSKHYGAILDRDLLFLGGFFHDIGKIWELVYDKVTDYTDEGRLIGHLVMGVEMVQDHVQKLNATPGRLPGEFPKEKVLLVKHLILSHHGLLEYGSPKRPKCLEAYIVHMVDDLDSKINSIQGFIEQDQSPGHWTALNKQYERYFWKSEPK